MGTNIAEQEIQTINIVKQIEMAAPLALPFERPRRSCGYRTRGYSGSGIGALVTQVIAPFNPLPMMRTVNCLAGLFVALKCDTS